MSIAPNSSLCNWAWSAVIMCGGVAVKPISVFPPPGGMTR